jgi:hypothetical protein
MGGSAASAVRLCLSDCFSCTSVLAWFLARIVVETTVHGSLLGAAGSYWSCGTKAPLELAKDLPCGY